MTALHVTLDGNILCTVCCDGFDLVDVRISGTRTEEIFASLAVTGGRYPDEGESTYLVWISELPLKPGQRVEVTLLQEGTTSHPGKTIDELFPDEKSPTDADEFKPTHEMFEELRRMPKLRDSYAFRYHSTPSTSCSGRTTAGDHGFSFSVVWISQRPGRARASLNTCTIDSVEQRTGGLDHANEHLQIGQSVAFELNTC